MKALKFTARAAVAMETELVLYVVGSAREVVHCRLLPLSEGPESAREEGKGKTNLKGQQLLSKTPPHPSLTVI